MKPKTIPETVSYALGILSAVILAAVILIAVIFGNNMISSYKAEQLKVHKENLTIKQASDTMKSYLPIIFKINHDSSFRIAFMNEYYKIKNIKY